MNPTQREADKMIALREQGYNDGVIAAEVGVSLQQVKKWFRYLKSIGIDTSRTKHKKLVPRIP